MFCVFFLLFSLFFFPTDRVVHERQKFGHFYPPLLLREKLFYCSLLYIFSRGERRKRRNRECEISLSQLLETAGGLPAGSENAKKKRYAKITTKKTAFREKRND